MNSFIDWRPIETAPYGKLVLLCGVSGCRSPRDKFICTGYRERDWRCGDWNTVQGYRLSDSFPSGLLFWAEISNFPFFTSNPGESE